jgi:hypothetical protein
MGGRGMSDLISRKTLIHGLMENYEKCMTIDGLLKYIQEQPIAYSVNKVVEQLEDEYSNTGMRVFDDCTNRVIDRAILIVKGAVKNE